MSTIVWLWLAANAFAALTLALELSNLREFPRLRERERGEAVAAVIALRDEAENVEGVVASGLAAREVAQLIAVDDGSRDDTWARLQACAERDARVRILRSSGSGKSAALALGAQARDPAIPWLLFLDADVRIAPGAPPALTAFARERDAEAVTAWPRVDVRSAGGLLFGPLVTLFLLQLLPMRLARGSDPRAAAGNGQCFLVDARAYERCGGHAALRETVVEDVALARALKRAGARVALASGASIATVAAYPSLAAGMRGFARSLYFGAGAAGCAFGAVWAVLLALSPLPLYLARIATAQRMRESAASVLLAPLAMLLACGCACYAIVAGRAGRLTWRGRLLRE